MNTAERVAHYADMTPEAPRLTQNDPPSDWPFQGTIEFKDVVLKYREDLPAVLKGLSFSINAVEKIGLVYRPTMLFEHVI